MTHRSVRRLRHRSQLRPTAAGAPPELKATYQAWAALVARYRRWDAARRADDNLSPTPPVDLEWVASFDQFLHDMGPKPRGHALVRHWPELPYGPENCHWAKDHPQSRGGCESRYQISHAGHTRTPAEWAAVLGIPAGRIYYRLRKGLTGAAALGFTSGEDYN